MQTFVVSNSSVVGDNSVLISEKDISDALTQHKDLVLQWNGESMTIPYDELNVIGQTMYKIRWSPDPQGVQGRYRQLSLFNLEK